MRRSNTICKTLLLLAAALLAFQSAPALADTLGDIRIEGAKRIEQETIRTYISAKPGDELNEQVLNRTLKDLFSTGLFADVQVRRDGGTMIVEIVENPIINRVAFEGNDDIDDKELQAESQLRPRQVFTRSRVQADVARLYEIYRRQGRFSAQVEPKVIKLDQNRVDLVFEIDEGPVTYVKSIKFIGNERFEDDSLRSEIATREKRWYRFLSNADRYDPDRLSFDEDLLRRFYLRQGYADFRVISTAAELSRNREYFFVTFTLEEGDRYKVGSVKIDSRLRDFDPEPLNQELTLAQGEWYDAEKLQETVEKLTTRLGDLQYAFVKVSPKVKRDRENSEVDITFVIEETPRVFVERIEISGNVRTLDKVIRREIELLEGDPFNRTRLAKSEKNLKDLGFFETVNVTTEPGTTPDRTVVKIGVAEKSTGELSIGAGFSSTEGPLADFRVVERNLLGKGQQLRFSTTLAGERTEFDIGFTEPYFLERDLSAGFDVFHITRDLQDESSFDQRRTGGSLRLGYPLALNWRQNLRYRIERNEIRDVDDDASRFIRDQEGDRLTSAIFQEVVYDNRDSRLFPTTGYMFWFNTELAGLGGDARYFSSKTGASYFYPVMEDVVLNVLGEVGAIEGLTGEEVQINERFFVGGNTLRGFERAGIGPRDLDTDDSLGGNRFYRGTVELSFPVGLPEELGIKGHSFTDFGSLWDIDEAQGPDLADESSLRAAAGFGVSWRSPLGPVRADFAFPYLEEDFDVSETFRFSFGTRF